MSRLKDSKNVYDNIPIPDRLEETVASAIEQAAARRKEENGVPDQPAMDRRDRKKRRRRGRVISGCGLAAAAALTVVVAVGVNTSPTFAEEIRGIPVIGAIVRLFTAESWQSDTDDAGISVEVPGIEMIRGETKNLAEEINEEIKAKCDAYAAAALERAKEYKKAFLDTGGTEAEWKEHDIQIRVWYELKSQNDSHLSFTVSGSENWVSAYSETYYYNIDLTNGRYLSLEDLLGPGYMEKANESIRAQIKAREADSEVKFFTKAEGGFETVTADTPFYINEKGNPVVVFEKYEIAPGALGRPEFEIERQTEEKAPAETTAKERMTEEQAESGGLDNFSVDQSEAEAFAGRIQKAVAEQDLEALADCISFPTYIGFPDEGVVVSTREEFLAFGKEKIFTADLISSIKNTDITALEASMAGFHMQEQSEERKPGITFGIVDGKLAVNGINY